MTTDEALEAYLEEHGHHADAEHGFRAGWAAALSTPPADDVREALAESLEDFMQDWYDRWAGPGETWVVRDMATSIVEDWLPKVRPRGTVTDAEVDAAGRHLGMGDGMEHWIDRDSVRAALEAAREVRS